MKNTVRTTTAIKGIFFSQHIVYILLLTLLGGSIRFIRLGEVDTRADEVALYEFMAAGITTRQMMAFHLHDFQVGSHMPIPRVGACAFMRLLDLKTSLFTIRLPFAIAGVLLIPALWLLGRYTANAKFGYVLAFLGILNPFVIYWSRVGHAYIYIVLFITLACAYFAALFRDLWQGAPLRRRHFALAGLFSACACNSHIAPWPMMGLLWGALIVLVYYFKLKKKAPIPATPLWLAFSFWLLLLAPWVVLLLKAMFTGNVDSVYKGSHVQELLNTWRLPFIMTYGWDWRAGVTISLLAAGVVGGLVRTEWRRLTLCTLVFGLTTFLVLSLLLSVGSFQIRYYSPMWLFFIVLSGIGLIVLADVLRSLIKMPPSRNVVLFALNCIVAMVMFNPVRWVLTLPGNPMPYTMINKWMDHNLPKGSLVIVDRWLEAGHEMRCNAPSNVIVTFTIPSEPIEFFQRNNGWERIKNFAARFPETAFLELTHSIFTVPGVGVWNWPRQYFAREIIFTNEPALRLREALLAPYDDYYAPDTNKIMVSLFYNLPQDIIARSARSGQPFQVMYGTDWQYVKTQDFRDWHALRQNAALHVYNLGSSARQATILIRAVAIPNAKLVHASTGMQHEFPAGKLEEWRLENIPLAPGPNQIAFRDVLWPKNQALLLVETVEILGHGVTNSQNGK